MHVVKFAEELKELMKKFNIDKITPIDEVSDESFIEIDKEKDTLNVFGFKFYGKFDHNELEKVLIENNADYEMS